MAKPAVGLDGMTKYQSYKPVGYSKSVTSTSEGNIQFAGPESLWALEAKYYTPKNRK